MVAQLAANQRMQKAKLSSAISQCDNGFSLSAIDGVFVDPCSSNESIPTVDTSRIVVAVSVGVFPLIVRLVWQKQR